MSSYLGKLCLELLECLFVFSPFPVNSVRERGVRVRERPLQKVTSLGADTLAKKLEANVIILNIKLKQNNNAASRQTLSKSFFFMIFLQEVNCSKSAEEKNYSFCKG